MVRSVFAVVVALMLSSCSHGTEISEPQIYVHPDEAFTLEVGQTADVEQGRLRVTFEKVLEDSRCPADVVCVHAGNARIALDVVHDGTPADIQLDTRREAVSAVVGDFVIALVALHPYPISERPQTEPSVYEATLKVTRR